MRTKFRMQDPGQSRHTIDTFGGYNHNERIETGEWYDMANLSSDHYPLLHPRNPRKVELRFKRRQVCGARAMGSDIWIVTYGTAAELYRLTPGQEQPVGGYDPANGYDIGLLPNAERRRMVSFGAYLLIWPDGVYFNTADPTEFGNIESWYQAQGREGLELKLEPCAADGTVIEVFEQATAPADPQDGAVWMKSDDPWNCEFYRYSKQQNGWFPTKVYAKLTVPKNAGFENKQISEYFAENDSVSISLDCDSDDKVFQEGYRTILAAKENYIVLNTSGIQMGALGDGIEEYTLQVIRECPKLDYVFKHDNRVWGCSWYVDADGKIVNEIRASKLGDFKNWNSFQGIASDSYVISCGSDGKWTGGAEVGGYPCFFKERYLHKVYGDTPSSYSCDAVELTGVQEGCEQSMATIENVLYYKARNGVYRYDGSSPVCISAALGYDSYQYAVGAAWGSKYYIELSKDGENYELFVYDARYGLWHKEGEFYTPLFVPSTYGLNYIHDVNANGELMVIAGGTDAAKTEEQAADIEWFAESGIIGEYERTSSKSRAALPEHKYYPQMVVRMSLTPGAQVRFFAEYDSSGHWEQLASVVGTGLRSFNLPLRPRRCDHMRLRIEGVGEATIRAITYIAERGSYDR